MIYVLVRVAQDYDETDEIVFASTSKEVVEAKHDKLLVNHRIMKRFAKMCKHDMELYSKNNPPPPAPNLVTLPLLPLVWEDGKWNNAYMLAHDKELSVYHQKVNEFREHLIERLRKDYDWSDELVEELENIWWYNYDYTYEVKEVESD